MSQVYIPFVQCLDGIPTSSVQNPHQVYEHCFPYTQFELMQKIGNKYHIKVEAIWSEPCRECVLRQMSFVKYQFE